MNAPAALPFRCVVCAEDLGVDVDTATAHVCAERRALYEAELQAWEGITAEWRRPWWARLLRRLLGDRDA